MSLYLHTHTHTLTLNPTICLHAAFIKVGGYQKLIEMYPYATASERAVGSNNETCGEPPADYMNLIRTIEPGKSNFPWTGMVFGLTINSIWYWCTDQVGAAHQGRDGVDEGIVSVGSSGCFR